MPNACFVDTNILLYASDPKTPSKRVKARAWLDTLASEGRPIVSPQVLNEYAHNILKKFPHVSHEQLFEDLEALRPWCIASMTGETALQGLVLHRRYRFSFYDCTLLAAALTYGCDVFLSEDMSHQQMVGTLRIVNPFAVEPSAFLSKN